MSKASIATRAILPMSRNVDQRCASQFFGTWSIEPKWFRAAMAEVRAGTFKATEPKAFDIDDIDDGDDDDDEPLYSVKDGVALICIDGQMTKRGSSFGGCSTVATRAAVRSAAADSNIKGIMLHICSPGGTVAGTADLAEDVAAAAAKKPTDAYIADCGCSAAYWVASQCRTIYANTTAMIGSIGTYALLEDDTGLQEQVGIKYTIVSTGEYKGLGADGEVTDKLVADVQREVNELNASFLQAVASGRGNKITDLPAVADGRAYASAQAQKLGLIDQIASLDVAMSAITNEVTPMDANAFKTYAAEHPEAVAGYIEQGKKAGIDEERARAKGIVDACGGNHSLAVDAIVAGHTADSAKLAAKAAADAKATAEAGNAASAKAIADKDAEIAKLKEQVAFVQGGQPPVAQRGTEKPAPTAAAIDPNDHEAVAKSEWTAMDAEEKSSWVDEKTYVGYRKAELNGQVKAPSTRRVA